MSSMPPFENAGGAPPPFETGDGGPPPFDMGDGSAESAGDEVSFGASMSAFGKMMKIQEAISEFIPKSKVPWNETRRFLRAYTKESIEATPLYQFMLKSFKDLGLGEPVLLKHSPMHYVIGIMDCPVCSMYPTMNNAKVCVATSDTFYKFFTDDLELTCSVEEIECVKDGGKMCTFKIDLQPLAAYQILLDAVDIAILKTGKKPASLPKEQFTARARVLFNYKLIEQNKVSEAGIAYVQYAGSMNIKEKVFDPPWKAAEQLTQMAKDKGSFASLLSSVATSTPASVVNKPKVSDGVPMSPAEGDAKKAGSNESGGNIDKVAGKEDSFAKLMAKMKGDG